jgi:hypothetical protein
VNDRLIEAQEQATLEVRRDGADGPLVGTLTLQIADDDAGAASHPAVYRYAKLAPAALYFYTASEPERQAIARDYPDFRFEGPVFYGEALAGPGLAPVYRYANVQHRRLLLHRERSRADRDRRRVSRPALRGRCLPDSRSRTPAAASCRSFGWPA